MSKALNNEFYIEYRSTLKHGNVNDCDSDILYGKRYYVMLVYLSFKDGAKNNPASMLRMFVTNA